MAGGFEGGVCGGNWWNPSQNLFTSSSPCLLPINDMLTPMKTTSSTTTTATRSGSASDESSMVLQEINGNSGSIHSALKMIETNLFSSANTHHEWTQDLLFDSGKSEQNYYSHNLPQESSPAINNSSMNYRNKTRDDNTFCERSSSSAAAAAFSTSQSYNSSVSRLLQHLFDLDSQPPQQSSFRDYMPTNYSSPMNDMMIMNPTLSKQQNHLQVTNNTPSWDPTSAMDNVPATLHPLSQSSFLPSSHNFAVKVDNTILVEEAQEMAKKARDGPPLKRPRIETPSPLPTFKVRKEKLGDRVTALQQLVSPFGKTDTASVLYEAIEYIKFHHDKINALTTPYLKSSSPPLHCQQGTEIIRHQEELNKDLKSRGLCLVPVSSTFPVASETTADFWTPIFGGSYM